MRADNVDTPEVRGDPSGGGGIKHRREVQASADVDMHLREVLKLARNCRQGIRDEEERVRDCEEDTAEKEPPSTSTEETSGASDSEFVPNADDLQRSDSNSSCTSESVTCSGATNPEAGALAAHVAEEEAAADFKNLIAKEVNHTCLLTVELQVVFHIPLEFI